MTATDLRDHCGWVIEHGKSEPGRPTYWCGGDNWAYDSELAVRFCREDDASRVACHLMPQPTLHRIAYHCWT